MSHFGAFGVCSCSRRESFWPAFCIASWDKTSVFARFSGSLIHTGSSAWYAPPHSIRISEFHRLRPKVKTTGVVGGLDSSAPFFTGADIHFAEHMGNNSLNGLRVSERLGADGHPSVPKKKYSVSIERNSDALGFCGSGCPAKASRRFGSASQMIATAVRMLRSTFFHVVA